MASFGAKYPHFSKIKTEPDDALLPNHVWKYTS